MTVDAHSEKYGDYKVVVCPALAGKKHPILFKKVVYVSPAMHDLLDHAETDEEIEKLADHMQPVVATYFDFEKGVWW